ncbi:MAG: GAF domain-containing sensor histidine kinase [Mycobacteriales bacterium]
MAALMTSAAAAGVLLPAGGRVGQVVRTAEAAAWGVAVTATGTVNSPYLTYLLAPALVGGMVQGTQAAVLVPGAGALALLVAHAADPQRVGLPDFSAVAAQWVVLAAVAAVMGATTRRLPRAAPSDDQQVTQAAHRLLVQLRTLSRRLPGSLDPTTTAQALLHTLRERVPYDEGWVLIRSGGEGLQPLSSSGSSTLEWDLSTSHESTIMEAWATQQPTVGSSGHLLATGGHSGGTALAVPLAIGPSGFGVVALLSHQPQAYTSEQVAEAAATVRSVALALDTGLLFDEIRQSATAEERARLSREIHDGVAQDIASLGYVVDGLTFEARGRSMESGLIDLRQELTRVVTELRLSLFDLRAGVEMHAGLGAALSEHVRRIGAGSDLTVHLSLSEAPQRLSPKVEAELLRIAQEAMANARKHSGAANLWVGCHVSPPEALLVVEDDGVGLAPARRASSHGLAIMKERAARAGAVLEIGTREDGTGTRVAVSLGTVADV